MLIYQFSEIMYTSNGSYAQIPRWFRTRRIFGSNLFGSCVISPHILITVN
jgi:hypothetical protein